MANPNSVLLALHADEEQWYEQVLRMVKEVEGKEESHFEFLVYEKQLCLSIRERDILIGLSNGLNRLLEREGFFTTSYSKEGIIWFVIFCSKGAREDFWRKQRQAAGRFTDIFMDEASYFL